MFSVITGKNGTGKSQLLKLIYGTIIKDKDLEHRVTISGETYRPEEVRFLHGEWQLNDASELNYARSLTETEQLYSTFRTRNQWSRNSSREIALFAIYEQILKKSGKNDPTEITKDEFIASFPEYWLEGEERLPHLLSRTFYDYRISQIDLKDQDKAPSEIMSILGRPPWEVLRDIIRESNLPFEINDPGKMTLKQEFKLTLTHSISGEIIKFGHLSSGEKVLLSLAFFLYSSREKNTFARLLLFDEPDAHLHPSMSRQFLDVIKNVLVDRYGVRVIMSTHSPSTVVIAPDDSLFEMLRTGDRIRPCSSRNHLVSLLTDGIVFVGDSTRFVLAEAPDDVAFYNYFHNWLVSKELISSDIPLVFIAASTKTVPAGESVVRTWVEKFQSAKEMELIRGIIDRDENNTESTGLVCIDRYCYENFLVDPLVTYAALLDLSMAPAVDGISLGLGDEKSLMKLDELFLQRIVDVVIGSVRAKLPGRLKYFDPAIDDSAEVVHFMNGKKLNYPRWILYRSGKDILNQVYREVFGTKINRASLMHAMKKIEFIPVDLTRSFSKLKDGLY